MRIVKVEEFLKLPEGTIYQKYSPMFFGDLSIKGETCGRIEDFFTTSIPWVESYGTGEMVATLEQAEKDSSFSFKLDFETMGRDGLFDHHQLFAVWERQDIEAFTDVLKAALCI